MSPMKNPKPNRKQTGTVPKITTSQAASLFRSAHTTQPRTAGAVKDPQQHVATSSSSHKSTEVVAPTRRELHDLNDYLLSVAESSSSSSAGPQATSKRSNSIEQSHPETLDPSCFDLDNLNLHENHRYCWPVRPLPRRSSPNRDFGSDIQLTNASNSIGNNHHSINYTNSNASGISSQAIGVVIPTTPNSTINEYHYTSLNRSHNLPPQIVAGNSNSIANQHHHHQSGNHQTDLLQALTNLDSELTWEQRLSFIQYFLSLTTRNLNKVDKKFVKENKDKDNIVGEEFDEMVNETQSEMYLNSASLEDVAQQEVNDTRAHSVTSIHSASIPTTPTYEELQAKLEASNRNIQSIREQQQQLLRLQQAAKDHLVEMENIRNQRSRTNQYDQNGSEPPNYESIGQVQSDMANLVNRMKNITTFIQGQNELSAMLGDDGPEILAEQEALQNKLIELQQQKEDIRHYVHELEEVNASAENTVKQRRHDAEEVPRVVPIEYQRIVPIELVGAAKNQSNHDEDDSVHADQIISNGHCNGSVERDIVENNISTSTNQDEESELTEEASDVIKQKMADIAAMKNQLKRLKDMMDTVKLIEGKTDGRSIQDIADEAEEFLASSMRGQAGSRERSHSNRNSAQREILPKTHNPSETETKDTFNAENEAEMSEKVRLLHEMTQDLRDQAANLASERDRLKALRDEMIRRKETEKMIEMAAPNNELANKNPREADTHQIRAEYDAKKKEFEKLCERLQNETDSAPEEGNRGHPEENNHDRKHENETNASYYQENWRPQNMVSSNSSGRGDITGAKQSTVPATPCRGKDSADSGAADVHGMASFEAGSMQSGSSRSFSMPPPMRTINARDATWRKNSQDNSQSQFEIYAPMPPPLPPTWNSNYYYSTPYAQHFNMHPPHSHHHHPINPSVSDYFCSHNCHASNNSMSQSVPAASNVAGQQPIGSQSSVNTNDPVLLQQFIQTQQMLINSVCQCNQLLWHQQREIINLNNAVMMLQERLIHPMTADTNPITHRAESVPPAGVTVGNAVYATHRAQSEQPNQPFSSIQQPLASPSRSHHFHHYNYASNYHRRNVNSLHQQQSAMSSNAAAYNYVSTEHGPGICSQLPPVGPQPPINHTLDFVNVPQTQQTSGFINSEAPHPTNIHQIHPAGHPMYMHHHNNTDVAAVNANLPQQQQQPGQPPVPPPSHLHTNNHSNLLTSQQQNCLNSPPTANVPQSAVTSSSITHGPNNNNAVAAASALNNQVPPGNRANNYWDNFRSYSRQNLLSNNSCKSNEEQQQISGTAPAFPMNGSNTNLNGFRNLHNAMNAMNAVSAGNSASYSNNLTPPTFDGKHLYTFRNHLNSNLFNEHESQNPLNHGVATSQPTTAVIHSLQATQGNYVLNAPLNRSTGILINQSTQSENLNINSNELHNPPSNTNNASSNANASVAAIFGSNDFRNMNFNFGANELRKKISVKSACSTKRIRHSQSMTNEMTQLNCESMSSTDFDEGAGVANEPSTTSAARIIADRNIYGNFDDQQQLENEYNDDDNVNADNSNASGYSESSEENKKNLLVNALRNDKFTSKFFERLKEDVYREVYSILQATESQPQYLEQLYKELQLVPTSDPIRNIVMQAMHDIYKRSSIANNVSSESHANNSSEANMAAASSPYENVNQSSMTQSGNNQENELMNTLLNSTELRRLAYKIMFDSERSSSPFEKVGIKPNLSSSSASSSPKPPTEIYRPDYDLVNHIMTIIRNSVQTQRFDDDTIMKITKLTISTLERISNLANNSLPTERLAISARDLYQRMRAFDRRDRDEFLARCESLLQTMLVMKVVNDDANNLNLVKMKKASSSNANLLTNSFPSNASDSHNLRRQNVAGKSNISGHSVSLNCLEVNGGRKIDRQHCDVGNGGHMDVSNTSGNLYHSRSVQEDLKRQQHHQSAPIQKDTKCRRNKSNTTSHSTLNQLIFTSNSNTANDISPNSDTLSSSTINSNNITNEDLAEADQVCSSSSPAPAYCDTASGSSSRKSSHKGRQQHNNHVSTDDRLKEIDDNKNFGWMRKDSIQLDLGMPIISAKQEAESENFEISSATVDHINNSNDIGDRNTRIVDEVTCSSGGGGKAEDNYETDPLSYDTACAVITHQSNSNPTSGNIVDSLNDRVPSSTSTLANNGNPTTTMDGKQKNGVP